MATDFFSSQYGNYWDLPRWRKREFGRLIDPVFNLRLALNPSFRRLESRIKTQPQLNVLIAGVEVPARANDLDQVMRQMTSNTHRVERVKAMLHQGKGKFQNINLGMAAMEVDQFDWLIVTDDDVSLPENFLDTFLYLAESADLKLCQPAHNLYSYASYAITQRHWNSLVRTTRFVECGPITAFRREMFPLVLPFPELRWAWGNDLAWADLAGQHNFRIGVVDGTPIGHLRPVAGSYDSSTARLEGEAYLHENGVNLSRFDALQTHAVYTSLEGMKVR